MQNYIQEDSMLIDKIVYEVKSQGIFDQFRKECIADVDTKPAYQNLRQRVEGSVSGFLSKQKWSPDMNKNHLREMLRKNIYESGFLETGVERIVDQVVNPKINSVFLPKVTELVYNFFGIRKPNENQDSNSNNLLPTDLEAVSPESSRHSEVEADDSKVDEDESPPFEPLEDQIPYVAPEETSVDSHLSGFSGLVSHDSNGASGETVNKPAAESSNQESVTSKLSSDRLSIVTSDDNDTKMEVEEGKIDKVKKEEKEKKIDSNSTKKDEKKDDKSHRNKDKEKSDRKHYRKDHHDSSSSKPRDRKENSGSSSNSKKHEKDHNRDKSSHRHSSGNGSSHRSHKESTSSVSKDRERSKSKSSKDGKDRETSKDRHKDKDDKKKDDRKRHHSSSDKYKKDDKYKSSSRSKDKKDHKNKDKKDCESESKKRTTERRSTDRDSNDGHSSLKSSSSSFESFSTNQINSSQRDKKESNVTNNSGDSGNSDPVENTNLSTETPNLNTIKLYKPKFASNIHEARRLMKIRKKLAQIEKERNSRIGKLPEIEIPNIEVVVNKEKSPIEKEKIDSPPLPSVNVSAASWDALEAKLNETIAQENYYKESYYDSPDTPKRKESPCIKNDEDCYYLAKEQSPKIERYVKFVSGLLGRLEKEIEETMESNNKCEVVSKKTVGRRKRKFAEVSSDVKNNNKRFNIEVHDNFTLPLSPAESDNSVDKKSDISEASDKKNSDSDAIDKAKKLIRAPASKKRYSNEDLYKPRLCFSSSKRRLARSTGVD